MSAPAPRSPILAAIAAAPMHRLQILAVAISIGLNALDGFDVLAITFAAPGIAAAWRISAVELGVAISAGLAGMAIGSLFVAPAGDRIGRRPPVLGCLAVMAAGMFLSATATGLTSLCAWRLLTGIGIGGMVAAINAVASEFANDRRRALSVALMTVGYPVGGLVGGFVVALLVQDYGWRSIFVFGGIVTTAFLPVAWFGLPESFDHLARQSGARARAELDRLLARIGQPANTASQAPPAATADGGARELLGPRYRTLTLLLVAGYFLHILVFYFYSGWLPKMMSDLGFSTADAIRTSAYMSVGGVIGGAGLGWAAPRFGLGRLVIAAMIGTAIALAIFGNLTSLGTLQAMAGVVGFCIFGGIVGLYSILAQSFPARMRVTGTGLAIGLGRGGAIMGPIIGGVLLDAGLRAGMIIAVVGLFSPLSALLLAMARRHERRSAGAVAA